MAMRLVLEVLVAFALVGAPTATSPTIVRRQPPRDLLVSADGVVLEGEEHSSTFNVSMGSHSKRDLHSAVRENEGVGMVQDPDQQGDGDPDGNRDQKPGAGKEASEANDSGSDQVFRKKEKKQESSPPAGQPDDTSEGQGGDNPREGGNAEGRDGSPEVENDSSNAKDSPKGEHDEKKEKSVFTKVEASRKEGRSEAAKEQKFAHQAHVFQPRRSAPVAVKHANPEKVEARARDVQKELEQRESEMEEAEKEVSVEAHVFQPRRSAPVALQHAKPEKVEARARDAHKELEQRESEVEEAEKEVSAESLATIAHEWGKVRKVLQVQFGVLQRLMDAMPQGSQRVVLEDELDRFRRETEARDDAVQNVIDSFDKSFAPS